MESGLFVTFFETGEAFERELPPVGPLDNVVLRQHVLLAERRSVQQAHELGVAIDRWLEAELEMQRATGAEPGGPKRTQRRFSARDGVYLRFAVFGDAHERDLVPELGPFAVVVVRPLTIEADGAILATRAASDLATWALTSASGDETVGVHKPDVAFRTKNTSYHPSITPTAARERAIETPVPTVTPAPQPTVQARRPAEQPPPFELRPAFELPPLEPTPSAPPRPVEIHAVAGAVVPAAEPPLTPDDRAMIDQLDRERRDETLRARIQVGERKRLGLDEPTLEATNIAMRYRPQQQREVPLTEDTGTGLEWGPALWRMRFAIMGVLLLGVGLYAFLAWRTGTAPTLSGAQQVQYVGVAQRFSSAQWEFVVNGVQKVAVAGTARARGNYYVVRLGVTNKGADGQQLSPSDFTIVDANGTEYAPEGLSSGPYQSGDNPGSPYLWPQSFPAGKSVTFSVIFDIDPSLPRGMLLKVSDQRDVRVRLD